MSVVLSSFPFPAPHFCLFIIFYIHLFPTHHSTHIFHVTISHITHERLRARGKVDRMLGSRPKGVGFDYHCWSCVEVMGKLPRGT